MDNYSFSEFIENIFSYVRTKLFFSKCRFIRFPFYLRGKKSLSGGYGLTIGRFCRFELEGKNKTLHIGQNCEFGDNTHLVALKELRIGDNVLIASKCFISDSNHGQYSGEEQDSPYLPPNQRGIVSQRVQIGNNVWIGENAVILAGTIIGNGCIVGANSTVKGNFPDNVIIAGSPARIIKEYNVQTGSWEKMTGD